MSKKETFFHDEEIPLLTQEKIDWGDEKKTKRRWTRYRRAKRVLVLALFVTITLIFGVFLVGALAIGVFDGIRLAIAESVLDYFDVDTGEAQESEAAPESEPKLDSESIPPDSEAPDSEEPESQMPESEPMTLESLYRFDMSAVPEGHTAVIPMDLSLYSSGDTYINNSTGYMPDTELLLQRELGNDVGFEDLASTDGPVVLIMHTHGTEAYLDDGIISYLNDDGELARSEDRTKNVVTLGEEMANILNENGIRTIHCTFMHDSVGYRNSYSRAQETIKEYLEIYPSIKLIIDLHRDGVTRSTGELVRPVTLVEGKPVAQVMCVVGSDFGGEACPYWQNNLSLALKLRSELNEKYLNLCRPTDLRGATYNQEFSKYSLLIEIGSCGNGLEEARRATVIVAEALAKILKEI